MPAKVILSISYDTEQVLPNKLPENIMNPENYTKLTIEEKKTFWADYFREGSWSDIDRQKKLGLQELEMIEKLGALFSEYNGAFTSFVLGQWLDFMVSLLEQKKVQKYFSNPTIDIQSHSYHHKSFPSTGEYTAIRMQVSPHLSLNEINNELALANTAIVKHLGVTPIGLRTPMGNLSSCSDKAIMSLLRANGIKFISSWLKKAQTEPNMPNNSQPFFYKTLGFPDILEIPGVGYYDVHLTQPTRLLVFDDERIWSETEKTDYYIGLLEKTITLAAKRKQPIYVPLVFHPWAVCQYDPGLNVHSDILKFCAKEKIEIYSYAQIYKMLSA